MYCLDTYALVEIAEGNPKFVFLLKEDFVIPSTSLAEFYWVLLKERGKAEADRWSSILLSSTEDVPSSILIDAQGFRYEHKKQKLSFFDCAGYIFARQNNYAFVTGDKEFEGMNGVRFIKK